MNVTYNEIDRHAAAWLRELIDAGCIEPGTVDERSIVDLRPGDCTERMHFFAGIGGWPYALDLAGWPATEPVWTGSCPCQPFSVAGKRRGTADERHLWPVWRELIRECRPATVFGEQVASRCGRAWLSSVRADLEAMGYAVGAADLCAAGVGAPHIRQRLYWVAHLRGAGLEERVRERRDDGEERPPAVGGGGTCGVADAVPAGRAEGRAGTGGGSPAWGGCPRRLVHPDPSGLGVVGRGGLPADGYAPHRADADGSGASFWSPCDWIPCRDGRLRPAEPESQQMVDGFPSRMDLAGSSGIQKIEKEITSGKASEGGTKEALLHLWLSLAEEADVGSAGRLWSFSSAEVLLFVLRQLKREGWHLVDHIPQACFEDPETGMRVVREKLRSAPCASQGRESVEQLNLEPSNIVPILSQALAQAATEAGLTSFPLAARCEARTGLLRGYGNAIVPQVAAAFVTASMEAMK